MIDTTAQSNTRVAYRDSIRLCIDDGLVQLANCKFSSHLHFLPLSGNLFCVWYYLIPYSPQNIICPVRNMSGELQ